MHKSTFFNSDLNSVEISLLKELRTISKGIYVQLWFFFITQLLLGFCIPCSWWQEWVQRQIKPNLVGVDKPHCGKAVFTPFLRSGWLGRTDFLRVMSNWMSRIKTVIKKGNSPPSRPDLNYSEGITVICHPTTTLALCLQAHGPRRTRRWAEERNQSGHGISSPFLWQEREWDSSGVSMNFSSAFPSCLTKSK